MCYFAIREEVGPLISFYTDGSRPSKQRDNAVIFGAWAKRLLIGMLFAISVGAQGPGQPQSVGVRFGPPTWLDASAMHVRAVNPPPQTTVACTDGSAVVTGSFSGFLNGDGLTIYGCGPTARVATPPAPSLVAGSPMGLMVPDVPLVSVADGSAYSYMLVARDRNGGLSAAGPLATITTGASQLGILSCPVASESLTGQTLTIKTTSRCDVPASALIHVHGSSNARLTGWFNIASASGKTLTFNRVTMYSETTVASTGGTLTYGKGIQLSWPTQSNLWQMYICARRPGDTRFHVIGASYPGIMTNGGFWGSTDTTFTDWGSPITTAPQLPPYVTDAICTATAPAPEYLNTTISSIGSNGAALAARASTSQASAPVYFDDGINIAAAWKTAQAHQAGLFFPTSAGYYWITSVTNMSGMNQLGVVNSGTWMIGETVTGYAPYTGGTYYGHGAYPLFYSPCGGPGVGIDQFSNSGFALPGNNYLGVLMACAGNPWSFSNNGMGATDASSDYSGIMFAYAGGTFPVRMENLGFHPGPNQNTDSSWVPSVYFSRGASGSCGDELNFSSWYEYSRGLYVQDTCAINQLNAHQLYCQGCITPTIATCALQPAAAMSGTEVDQFTNDTSMEPYLAWWNCGGTPGGQVIIKNMFPLSWDTAGPPEITTGFDITQFGNSYSVVSINNPIWLPPPNWSLLGGNFYLNKRHRSDSTK
jgi:hypothetical protein